MIRWQDVCFRNNETRWYGFLPRFYFISLSICLTSCRNILPKQAIAALLKLRIWNNRMFRFFQSADLTNLNYRSCNTFVFLLIDDLFKKDCITFIYIFIICSAIISLQSVGTISEMTKRLRKAYTFFSPFKKINCC